MPLCAEPRLDDLLPHLSHSALPPQVSHGENRAAGLWPGSSLILPPPSITVGLPAAADRAGGRARRLRVAGGRSHFGHPSRQTGRQIVSPKPDGVTLPSCLQAATTGVGIRRWEDMKAGEMPRKWAEKSEAWNASCCLCIVGAAGQRLLQASQDPLLLASPQQADPCLGASRTLFLGALC